MATAHVTIFMDAQDAVRLFQAVEDKSESAKRPVIFFLENVNQAGGGYVAPETPRIEVAIERIDMEPFAPRSEKRK